jgi:hypothetical protein
MPNIGIVTSTKFSGPGGSLGDDFKDAFETGFSEVSTGGVAPTYATNSPQEANGNYTADGNVHRDLFRGVRQLQRGAQKADIIVAVGGLVAAHAAVLRSDVPFLVLIGRVPESDDFALTDNENYRGGIDLRAANHNRERRNALVDAFNIPKEDIWLLFNPNSRMGKSEAHDWRQQGGRVMRATRPIDDDDPNGNDENEFAPAFQRLLNRARPAKGVVVSGDPFFALRRNAFVTAANHASTAQGGGMKMCYPFEIFGDATPKPALGSGITIGPNLIDAYKEIGRKAAWLVRNGEFQGLDTVPLVPRHDY